MINENEFGGSFGVLTTKEIQENVLAREQNELELLLDKKIEVERHIETLSKQDPLAVDAVHLSTLENELLRIEREIKICEEMIKQTEVRLNQFSPKKIPNPKDNPEGFITGNQLNG